MPNPYTENNLTDIFDGLGNHTHFDYINGRQTLSKATFPSGFFESYSFNNLNALTSKTDRNGQAISYIYDFQERLSRKTYPDSSTVIYTYDPASRLTQVVDPTGTYSFSYDNMDRLSQTTTNYAFDTAGNLTVQYGYDAASNRNSMTDPQSLPTTYGYDKLNRLNSLIFNGQTPGFTFGYDGLSRRNLLTRPNGINTSYGYDPISHLLNATHKIASTGAVIDGAAYTYDNAGNRKTRTDKRTGTNLTFTLDNIYQLTKAAQGTTTKETYSYDLVGNRLSSLGVSPYMYNTSNELTSRPNVTYTYDNNGSTKTKVDATGGKQGDCHEKSFTLRALGLDQRCCVGWCAVRLLRLLACS